MADTLTVRVYNVRFGDAILVTVPDRDPATEEVTKRRMLIDVGNVQNGSSEGGDDSVFKPVVDDIFAQLGDNPLDLYVLTHEHLDHVQGLPHVALKHYDDLAGRLRVNRVWMTASAAPDYYDTHTKAKKQLDVFRDMYCRLDSYVRGHQFAGSQALARILAINDSTKTKHCVDWLRTLAPEDITYIYRGVDLAGQHPFNEATFDIWAPEEDTSEYYGKFQPLALDDAPGTKDGEQRPLSIVPPAGVDVGAFLNLVEARRNGIADNLLAIDQAANNTSIVFLLTWRGWRLLFAGDAELRSWKTMQKMQVLGPVHFLKVAHHGSHNGTPSGELFGAILPTAGDGRERSAAISVWTDTYSGIPDPPTNARISDRCTLHTTLDDKEALFYDLEFADLAAPV